MDNAITVKGLKKSFGDNHVLKGVDFTVKKGTIFALLGSNGAGKTTAVRILSTLMLPDAGEVIVGASDVVHQDRDVRNAISLTGQYASVDELLTGRENMLMMGRFSHVKPALVEERTNQLLERLNLTKAASRRVETYSGGMRRRLDLAISLLAQPPIIFLDEPTTGLDPRSRREIWQIIKDLVADGATIFLTTQYLEEADQLADTIAVLHDGKIVAEGTAASLKRRVGGEVVTLGFGNAKEVAQARRIIDGQVVSKDDAKHSLEVTTDGSVESLRGLLNRLADKDITPTKVQLHEPTLDDVFMQLTETKKEEK